MAANPTVDENGYLDLTVAPSYVDVDNTSSAYTVTVTPATTDGGTSTNMTISATMTDSKYHGCQWGWWDDSDKGLSVSGVYSSIVATVKSASAVYMNAEVVDGTWSVNGVDYIESTATPTDANTEATITLDISGFTAKLDKISLQATTTGQTIEVVSIQFIEVEVQAEPEPEVTSGTSIDWDALKTAIATRLTSEGYTLSDDGKSLTKENTTVAWTDDNAALQITQDDLNGSSNEWLTLGTASNVQVRYREQGDAPLFQVKNSDALSVTLEEAGTITALVTSTGNSYSSFGLRKSCEIDYIALDTENSDMVTTEATAGIGSFADSDQTLPENAYSVYGTGYGETAVWNVEAGTYVFDAYINSNYNRATRFYDIIVEEGTTEVTPEPDENGIIWDAEPAYEETSPASNGDYVSVNWSELDGYDAVKLILTLDDPSHVGYGLGTVTPWSGSSVYDFVSTAETTEFILTVEELRTLLGADDPGYADYGFGFNLYNVSSVIIYYGVYADVPASGEETINGYLTVSVGGETVGDANQKVTVTVTEDTDGKVTIDLGDLSVVVTISDASVTFTPDAATGEFTNGVVSGTISNSDFSADATGSYVVADGETTFTASFTYTAGILGTFDIEVSFTTVEPVVEPEWLLVTDEFDAECVADLQNANGTNNTVTITFAELGDATAIRIVTTFDPDKFYGNYMAILTQGNWNSGSQMGSNYEYTKDETSKSVEIDVSDIKAACAADATEFYICCWDNVTSIEVYAYATELGSEDTDSSTEEVTPEAGWTLTEHTKVGYESISWDELEGYDAVKFVLYYDGAAHEGWGLGGIYSFADGNNAVYSWTGTADDPDVWIITVEDLKELVGGTDAGGFGYNTWSPVVKIEVYFGVGEFTTTAIANIKSDAEVVEVARYNLMGQKISGAEKGINIIVYSDGSAKKVLVK